MYTRGIIINKFLSKSTYVSLKCLFIVLFYLLYLNTKIKLGKIKKFENIKTKKKNKITNLYRSKF